MELEFSKQKQTKRVRKKKHESVYRFKSDDNISNTLWRWFSKYIRLRDCNQNGWGYCITCNKPIQWSDGHAGHCLSRRYKAIKYDERNVNLQCVSCNSFHGGRPDVYREKVDCKYGKGTYEELESKKNNLVKHDRVFFIAMTEKYKMKLKELCK